MEYVILFLSGIGILYAKKFRDCHEKLFLFKLLIYWFFSIITITISGSAPLPFGLAIIVIIFLNTRFNRRAKLYAILSGFAGYVLSLFIFIITH